MRKESGGCVSARLNGCALSDVVDGSQKTEGCRHALALRADSQSQSSGRSPQAPAPARVFFALWPDAAVRDALDRLAGELHRLRGGRRTRAQTLHLTLVFVGNLPRERLPALQAAAAAIQASAFTLTLDRTDCWPHNHIAHATASHTPAALLDLVAALKRSLDGLGIAFDHRPYKAHVTLLRNADCRRTDPPIAPIAWHAREFVLVESELSAEGARYAILGRYPLVCATQR